MIHAQKQLPFPKYMLKNVRHSMAINVRMIQMWIRRSIIISNVPLNIFDIFVIIIWNICQPFSHRTPSRNIPSSAAVSAKLSLLLEPLTSVEINTLLEPAQIIGFSYFEFNSTIQIKSQPTDHQLGIIRHKNLSLVMVTWFQLIKSILLIKRI